MQLITTTNLKEITLDTLRNVAGGLEKNDVIKGHSDKEGTTLYRKTRTGEKKIKHSSSGKKDITNNQGIQGQLGTKAMKRTQAKSFILTCLNNTVKQAPERMRKLLKQGLGEIYKQHIAKDGPVTGESVQKFLGEANTFMEMSKILQGQDLNREKADMELHSLQTKVLMQLLHNPLDQSLSVSNECRLRAQEMRSVPEKDIWLCQLPGGKPPRSEMEARQNFMLLAKALTMKHLDGLDEGCVPKWQPPTMIAKVLFQLEANEKFGRREVLSSNDKGSVNRGNTVSSYYTSLCCRSVGSKWLQQLLEPTFCQVGTFINDQRLCFHEETKGEPKLQNSNLNHASIRELYRDFVERMCDSVDKLPQELCDLVASQHRALLENGATKEMARNGAIGVLLLRLVSPSLAAPNKAPFDLKDTKVDSELICGRKGREVLVLLGRLLQKQSNNSLFKDNKQLDQELGKHSSSLDKMFEKIMKRENLGIISENGMLNKFSKDGVCVFMEGGFSMDSMHTSSSFLSPGSGNNTNEDILTQNGKEVRIVFSRNRKNRPLNILDHQPQTGLPRNNPPVNILDNSFHETLVEMGQQQNGNNTNNGGLRINQPEQIQENLNIRNRTGTLASQFGLQDTESSEEDEVRKN